VRAHELERALGVDAVRTRIPSREDLLERLDVGALVVDDEDRDGVGA
jgi:hypothetical protein